MRTAASKGASPRLDDVDFARAGMVLGARCGLRFHPGNRELLDEGLARAAAAEQVTPVELIDRLERPDSDSLLQSVLRHVTIGETYFFRHPEHFDALREVVAPEVMRARRETRVIRAWSAGCASGEEAYSLAVALSSAAGPAYTVSVLGTDINRAALATAGRGCYGRWSQRGSMQCLPGYFTNEAEGTVAATPRLRGMTRFDYLNLRDPIYPSILTGTHGLDVIFCRNVLVYFFAEAATDVVRRLGSCLAEGGYLVLSALDLEAVPAGLEVVRHGATALLRRQTRRAEPSLRVRTSATPTPRSPVPMPAALPLDPSSQAARLIMQKGKAAADEGDLGRAIDLLREALGLRRSPEALHLLALILNEREEQAEAEALLAEAVSLAPDYALGHLGLGLIDERRDRARAARSLHRVLELLVGKRDEEMLAGPDPLPVSWVRKMAKAGLKRVEGDCD